MKRLQRGPQRYDSDRQIFVPSRFTGNKAAKQTQRGMRQMLSVKPDFLKGNRSDQGS